jgi:F0F1-type ATP synthase delta subunit
MKEILSQIRTTQDARVLQGQIQAMLDGEYEIGSTPNTPELLVKPLAEAPDKKQFLLDLKQHLTELSELTLTLAVEPDQALIDKISSWVKANLGPETVLSWTRNRTILGGAQVEYQGRYGDYSVKLALDRAFAHESL